MQLAVLGIDIGKTWFHIVGMDSAGKPVLRQKLNRQKLMRFMGTCQPCLVGIKPALARSF